MATAEEWRAKFVAYYQSNAPAKADTVTDAFMQKWSGKYEKLWDGLQAKYGPPGEPKIPPKPKRQAPMPRNTHLKRKGKNSKKK